MERRTDLRRRVKEESLTFYIYIKDAWLSRHTWVYWASAFLETGFIECPSLKIKL
jgi:hypothetical protein